MVKNLHIRSAVGIGTFFLSIIGCWNISKFPIVASTIKMDACLRATMVHTVVSAQQLGDLSVHLVSLPGLPSQILSCSYGEIFPKL